MICDRDQKRLEADDFPIAYRPDDFRRGLIRTDTCRKAVGANGLHEKGGRPGLDFEERLSGLFLAIEVAKAPGPASRYPGAHRVPAQSDFFDQRVAAAVDRLAVEGPNGPGELGRSAIDRYALKTKDLNSKKK